MHFFHAFLHPFGWRHAISLIVRLGRNWNAHDKPARSLRGAVLQAPGPSDFTNRMKRTESLMARSHEHHLAGLSTKPGGERTGRILKKISSSLVRSWNTRTKEGKDQEMHVSTPVAMLWQRLKFTGLVLVFISLLTLLGSSFYL